MPKAQMQFKDESPGEELTNIQERMRSAQEQIKLRSGELARRRMEVAGADEALSKACDEFVDLEGEQSMLIEMCGKSTRAPEMPAGAG